MKKVLRILSLLCHEFFHTWNVKRIRPVQLGPFDYTQEVYTPMHWLTEGFTSYYDDHLTYRCGFYTEKEYLELLSDDHVTKLLNVPGRKVLSVRDSSYLAWLKLYFQSADGVNRFPSYYLKGGVVALLLDLYIIDHSDGRSSLDDGMKALWARYQQDPSTGVTEEECIAILERSTGIQLRERLMSWLDGTDELPYAEVMEPIGLRFQIGPKPNDEDVRFGQDKAFASVAPKVSCGWSVSASNGSISVRSVLDGGPAQAAGIGVDDEIVALNGKRVTSVEALDRYLADHGLNPVRVTAHCDGRLYETTMTPEPVVIATITKIEPMSERQQRNFKRWLSRTS
jgi:predicted metalloprotease with PDZ domain